VNQEQQAADQTMEQPTPELQSQPQSPSSPSADQSSLSPMEQVQATIPPGVKAILDQAGASPLQAEVGEATDNTIPISQAKKPSKFDQKRQQIALDRLRRKMNELGPDGKQKTPQQAMAEIQREDYERMPADKKIARLENIISSMSRQFAADMQNLRRNDGAIADAFDINYRAIGVMMEKLGISYEDQKTINEQATAAFAADRQAKVEAEAQAAAEKMQKAKEVDEKDRMEKEAAKQSAGVQEEAKSEEDPHVEAGATVFG
jgi:hypothetical protein